MLRHVLRQLLSRNSFSRSARRAAVSPRRSTIRPALEPLEDRLVPSGFAVSAGGAGADAGLAVATDKAGDVFVARLESVRPRIEENVIDGHILQLTGDAGLITITDDRDWGIMVAIDGDAPLIYGTGIDKVIVNTGDRNDIVQYLMSDPDQRPADLGDPDQRPADFTDPDQRPADYGDPDDRLADLGDPDLRPADLEVHLGNGNDTLLVDTTGYAPLDNSRVLHIDVTGGAGVEHSIFRFGAASGNVDLEDTLGRKQNTVDVMIAGSPTEAAIPVFLKMNFVGTGGTDVVRARVGMDEPSGAMTHLNAALALSLIGGGGRSSVDVSYSSVEIDGAQTFVCPDDNTVQLSFHNVFVSDPDEIRFEFTGAGGRASNPGSTSAIIVNWAGGPLDGFVSMTERGGPSVDDVRVIYDFNPVREPTGGKPSDLHGDVVFSDPDQIRFEFTPTAPVS